MGEIYLWRCAKGARVCTHLKRYRLSVLSIPLSRDRSLMSLWFSHFPEASPPYHDSKRKRLQDRGLLSGSHLALPVRTSIRRDTPDIGACSRL